jgi:aryl-alcohol dehydrogenase-like predicted oxidoreductase
MRTQTRIATRPFGRTGMDVSMIGLGGGQIGVQAVRQEDAGRLLNAMLDDGVNVLDTASAYGESEEFIGNTVAHRRSDYWLFTKCGDTKDLNLPNFDRAKMEHEIDRSLRRLKTGNVDLMLIHTCGKDKLEQGDVIDVVQRAKDQGKTRFIGYSGDSDNALYAIDCGAFDAIEISVSIADQEAIDRGILQKAREKGMGVIAKRSIANVSWKPEPNDLQDISQYQKRLLKLDYDFLREDLPRAVERALRFTLAAPVDVALVGMRSIDHWKQDLAIVEKGPLPEEEFRAIRDRWREVCEASWVGVG